MVLFTHYLRLKCLHIVFFVTLAVILLRLAAPYAIQKAVNYALTTTAGLSGQVGDVDIALYRGAYQVENIELYLVDGNLHQPFIKIKQLDISLLWSALLRGSIVAEMRFLQAQIYYADKTQQDEHINEDVQNEQTWITLANRLVPFAIDRIDVVEGRLVFATIDGDQTTNTVIDDINGQVTNLTNSKDHSGSLVTHMHATALIEGICPLKLSGAYDPYASLPTFNFDVEMQRLPVKKLDHLISVYAPFDLEAGEIDFAMEFAANQGDVQGYAKAGIYELSVFDWHEDVVKDGDNPFEWLFESLTDAVAGIFENAEKDLIATQVPLEGKIDNIETPIWPAVYGIIKNAFIQSLEIEVDGVVQLNSAEKVDSSLLVAKQKTNNRNA